MPSRRPAQTPPPPRPARERQGTGSGCFSRDELAPGQGPVLVRGKEWTPGPQGTSGRGAGHCGRSQQKGTAVVPTFRAAAARPGAEGGQLGGDGGRLPGGTLAGPCAVPTGSTEHSDGAGCWPPARPACGPRPSRCGPLGREPRPGSPPPRERVSASARVSWFSRPEAEPEQGQAACGREAVAVPVPGGARRRREVPLPPLGAASPTKALRGHGW